MTLRIHVDVVSKGKYVHSHILDLYIYSIYIYIYNTESLGQIPR